jgi:asparagine synthetase B (glutamine-hydrolysing)
LAVLPFSGSIESGLSAENFEAWLYRLRGSFLCVIAAGPFRRIYLDAGGTHSLVFARDKQCAASTTGLLLADHEYRERFRAADYQALDIVHYGWFPAGLTAHEGVERLIASHYLDLNDWTAHRHWPKSDFATSDDCPRQAQQLIMSVLETIEPLTKAGSVVLALTAGQDSRLVLAATRPCQAAVSFYTIAMPQSALDVSTAQHMAKRFGLRHTVYPLIEATPAEARHWHYMASHCVGGPNARAHPSDRALNGFAFVLGGQGGEFGRAYLWHATDESNTRLNGEQLVGRLGLPRLPRLLERINTWLEGVARFSIHTQLDLAYLELRLSPWAYASVYAQNPAVSYISPFVSRRTFELILRTQPEARRGSHIMREALSGSWPELLEIPINRYGDYRDLIRKLALLADIPRVMQKLRKIMR